MTNYEGPPSRWPEPKQGQVRILLLGVYHMANPGLDEFNIEADDVLADRRQRELADLANRLSAWEPDRVAVEWPRDRQDELDDGYESYRSGAFEPTGDLGRRNEIVQVGFRLADQLDHDRVAAVDHKLPMDAHLEDDEAVSLDATPNPDDVPYPLPDGEQAVRVEGERLATSTIPEYLAFVNDEERLRLNGALTLAAGLHHGGDDHPGARLATAWYERNLRIVENLWNALDGDDERILFPVGSAHVRPQRHFLDEAPMFCPESPLPYLPDTE